LLGALEQFNVFFRDNGSALFLEDVDQALDSISPAVKPSMVAKYSLNTFIPLSASLLGDADEANTRIETRRS